VKLRLDEYAELNSPLHGWEPRYKLIGITVLIFAFAFVRDLRLLPAMLAVSGILYAFSRLPLSFLLARLRVPGFFLLIVVVLLPLFSGTTALFEIGPVAVREEGCLDLLLIVVKFVSILTAGSVLFGTTPFLNVVKTMRALGLPAILTDMILFSYRYLFEIGGNLRALETGMRLRGFRGRSLAGLSTLALLAGTILVRGHEQAENVYKAMILRGYGQGGSFREGFQARPRDLAGLLAVLLTAAGFVAAELFL